MSSNFDSQVLKEWITKIEEVRLQMYQYLSFQSFVEGEVLPGTVLPQAGVWKIEDIEGYAILFPKLPPMIRIVNRKTEKEQKHYYAFAAIQAFDWQSAERVRLPAGIWIVYTAPRRLYVDLDNFYRSALINAVVRTGVIPDDDVGTLSSINDLFLVDPDLPESTSVFVYPLDRMPTVPQIRGLVNSIVLAQN